MILDRSPTANPDVENWRCNRSCGTGAGGAAGVGVESLLISGAGGGDRAASTARLGPKFFGEFELSHAMFR